MPFITFMLIVAAFMGGTVSVAAQSALPDDPLWNFKVGVNERLDAALTPDGLQRANFDIAVIDVRIKEAKMLMSDGRPHAAAEAKLESNFNGHAKSVERQIALLDSAGDYAAAADVAARYQAVLARSVPGPLDLQATLDKASTLSAEAAAKAALE